MRWLLGIFATLALLWCGWWFAGQHLISREAEAMIAAERAKGATVEIGDLTVAGFPNRFDVSARDVSYLDHSGRFGWQGARVNLYAMSWKPWHIILGLPQSQIITLGDRQITLTGTALQASLRSAPDRNLPLKEARFVGTDVAVTTPGMPPFRSKDLAIALRDSIMPSVTSNGFPYALGLQLQGVEIDPSLLAALQTTRLPDMPEAPLPDQLDALHLDLGITLSQRLDRHLQGNPRPLRLDLRDLSVKWGELTLQAQGTIAPDAKGFAEGSLDLTVTNWQYLPLLLVASGKIPENRVGLATTMLKALAQSGSDPNKVSLPLLLKDGWVSFGPFPLGPAPQIAEPAGL